MRMERCKPWLGGGLFILAGARFGAAGQMPEDSSPTGQLQAHLVR